MRLSPFNLMVQSSTDPNGGTIVRYDWDFGDGQQSLGNTAPTVSHSYAAIGFYNTSLTVTASGGQQGSFNECTHHLQSDRTRGTHFRDRHTRRRIER